MSVTPHAAGPMQPLRSELMRHAPFAQMAAADVDLFVAQAVPVRYAADELVLDPAMGPVQALLLLLEGRIVGRRGLAEMAGGLQYEAGDLFPVGSVLGQRPVTSTYTAQEPCLCLQLPSRQVSELAARSAAFDDFLKRRSLHFFELSQRAMQLGYTSQLLAEQSLEATLGSLPRKRVLACGSDTPLQQALTQMHGRRVGSVLVTDDQDRPLGILTRHDILGRVTLPGLALSTPIAQVMSRPLHTLGVDHTLHDAALLMSRHGLRHVPVCEDGRVVNMVSERDLFTLQRLSLRQLSTQIRAAATLADFQRAAADIRQLARKLLGQGVQARQLTELISHLNDVLTETLVQMQARAHGMDLQHACWLAFGSEGRGEQTVATDQDNGLIFESDDPDSERPRWLAFAHDVNMALDACGYPLCKGQVMASNPACCLTVEEWRARFAQWIEHGAPEDLLKASIYFDLRALAGRVDLADTLRQMLAQAPARVPRFIKQMADNALRNRPPLNWLGAMATELLDGEASIDLKLRGTALFVDAARLYALAHGQSAPSTRARLEAAAHRLGVDAHEGQAWVAAFEFLQMLRLRRQIGQPGDVVAGEAGNRVTLASLNDLERKLLRETMRMARQLQQRISLDYAR